VLDDLQGYFSQLFEDNVVPINGWEEIAQEPTMHNTDDSMDER
jgi:hypothetical protein